MRSHFDDRSKNVVPWASLRSLDRPDLKDALDKKLKEVATALKGKGVPVDPKYCDEACEFLLSL